MQIYQIGVGIKRSKEESKFYHNGILETVWTDTNYEPLKNSTQNEATPDAILIVEEESNMVYFNKKFAKIGGMSDEIIISKDDNAALNFAMPKVTDPEDCGSGSR